MISRCLFVGALALAACTNARQIVLSIDTTAGVPCDIDRIRVVATAAGTTTIDQTLKGERLPVSVTLLDDTPNGNIQVDIFGYKGDIEVMHATGPLQFSSHRVDEPVLLEPTKCRPDAPCPLSEAMAAGAESPSAARLACGANVARYSASAGLDSFVDACQVPNSGKVLMTGSSVPVRLPDLEPALLASGFQFYGRPIHRIWVAKNGYIAFSQDNPDPNGVLLPGPLDRDIRHAGAAPPQQSVMVFWDMLTLHPTGVCYELDGAPKSQQLRVTWNGACLTTVCATDNLNFTITLEETTGRIALTYGTMAAGNPEGARGINATVGLVNDATGCPAEDCSLATGLCKDGVMSCGYSQVFSNTLQDPGAPNMQFVPVADPD